MATGAAAMLLLSLSGAALVARRAGGWRRWFAPLRGPLAGRLHVEIARVAVIGLVLSSATALWMTASTFDLLPDGGVTPAMPVGVSGETGKPLARISTLMQTPVAELRELSFPYPGDATDVFTLKTDRGTGYIDQGNGALLSWTDLTGWERVSETVYMLHTGQGAAALELVLGLMALGVPAMGATGVMVWLAGRRGRPRIRGDQPAGRAETILLVGSEGGSTWGFAATLHAALTAAGQSVHVGPMSAFAPERYGAARRIILLAATYGDGDAPASASGFLDRLNAAEALPHTPLAVLGFGDRSFPAYCAFAKTVAQSAEARGWTGTHASRHDRPPSRPRTRALGPRARGSFGDRTGVVAPARFAGDRDTDTRFAAGLRRRSAGPSTAITPLRPAARATLWQRLTGAGFARFYRPAT